MLINLSGFLIFVGFAIGIYGIAERAKLNGTAVDFGKKTNSANYKILFATILLLPGIVFALMSLL